MQAELTSSVDIAQPTITDTIVRQAAFNSLDPELWNAITDDDHIVDLQGAARALCSSLEDQITTYKAEVLNGRPEDADWYARTHWLYVRIRGLLKALGPKVKARNVRSADQLARIRYGHLRRAIIAHQERTLADGEPTEQDRLLWMALEESSAMRSDDPQPCRRGNGSDQS
jgi:hypothetical protein